ncbi:ATP-binding protein [Acidovorax sp. GBBC 3334]|uniref:sensor histidine kinase n=1 Tax=Acidovorax sp. GBBC 3334 TaxID=2940496 RepID=UPI0023049CF9|nr:ATP-binding protein [Acidovorax sp. GBBC 3334]MDA8455368.1 ATP-binding protein [Acidovorax sp. GBBC 3334]
MTGGGLRLAPLRLGFRALAHRLSRLPASTLVLVAGLAAAAGAITSAAVVSVGDMRSAMVTSQGQAQLLARVLEDQTTRTFEAGEVVLATLGQAPAAVRGATDRQATEDAMRQVLTALPFMRSVSLVNQAGLVLASTDAASLGITIDRARLGPWLESGGQHIGPLLPGRGLASLRTDGPAALSPPGLSFIPMLHGFRDETGNPLQLVALVNPDALSNFQYLALESLSYDAVIATDGGQVLASSIPPRELPGRDISALPVFGGLLPQQEHGSYVGQGVLGPDRILAFRASRSKPLVVIVEEPYHAAFMRWLGESYPFLAMELALVLLALALTWIAWRSLRGREASRQAMDAAQDRIARSERDLALLLRSVQELIFRTDENGVITYVNARWTALSGQPPDEAIGCRLQDLVGPGSRDDVAAMLDPRSGASLRNRRLRLRGPQGDERVLDVAAVPLRAAGDGAICAFAGSAVDVTEREGAHQRLRAQFAFQNLLLETSPQPMMLTDRAHRVILVNRAWENAMGRRRGHVVGQRLDLYPRQPADDAALAETGGGVALELDLPYGDGSRRATRVLKAAVHGERGEVTGVLSILMDISEFREAERATREARDAAEEAARTRSEFVANMSHELRTPLQSIIGFAELGVGRSPDARLASMFTDILAAGRRMLSLVNDLLDVAKIESAIGTIHLERTDLRGHIRAVARELGPLIATRWQELRIDLPERPLVAKVDPLRFQQVVRNVLANAIKFSPEGSCIHLRAHVDAFATIHIEVQDQGPGIPPAELERIFDAFAQSSLTQDGSGGTGLGLAICRKIVDALEGRIHARNVEGGAVFHIELPGRGPVETAPAPL